MVHTAIQDVTRTLEIQPGAVVSKVLHRDERGNVTVFAFDAGEGLSEHTASRTAVVEVLRGRLDVAVDDANYDAAPGFWMRMEAGAPHSLRAREPSIMLLTLAG